jgi:hypothetical protein
MNTESNLVYAQLDRNEQVDIEEADLEEIAATLPVRSGLRAGRNIQPCI